MVRSLVQGRRTAAQEKDRDQRGSFRSLQGAVAKGRCGEALVLSSGTSRLLSADHADRRNVYVEMENLTTTETSPVPGVKMHDHEHPRAKNPRPPIVGRRLQDSLDLVFDFEIRLVGADAKSKASTMKNRLEQEKNSTTFGENFVAAAVAAMGIAPTAFTRSPSVLMISAEFDKQVPINEFCYHPWNPIASAVT